MTGSLWTPEVFVDDIGYEPFTSFVESVPDFTFVALDAAIRLVLSVRGLELVRTEWLKALGDGLHEFRVRHDAEEITRTFGGEGDKVPGVRSSVSHPGPVLLRVFVHFHRDKVIVTPDLWNQRLDAGPDDRHRVTVRRSPREQLRHHDVRCRPCP